MCMRVCKVLGVVWHRSGSDWVYVVWEDVRGA